MSGTKLSKTRNKTSILLFTLMILTLMTFIVSFLFLNLVTFITLDFTEFEYDYTDYKVLYLNDNARCKIPESWRISYRDDYLCIYEELEGEEKIYFVQGDIETSGLPRVKSYFHPIYGSLILYEKLDSDYNTSSAEMLRGIFELENGDLKEICVLYDDRLKIALFSVELADEVTITKILHTLY
ncbi:MAG: hypothetical protein EOM87_01690 [Clostridia bacterium]|nr:hypothetical protein [Clostridia bacterium]